MPKRDGFRVEEWNGHVIFVDAIGTFFAREDGQRVAEAPTLEALKTKLAAPRLVMRIRALMFSRWNDEGSDVVTVYGVSGLGNVLYEDAGGKKSRVDRYERVYVYDEDRLQTRTRLRGQIEQASRELQQLMDSWPVVDRAYAEKVAIK